MTPPLLLFQWRSFSNCCFHPPPTVDMGWSGHFVKNHVSMTKATRTEMLGYSKLTPVVQRQYELCNTIYALQDLPRLSETPLTCSFLWRFVFWAPAPSALQLGIIMWTSSSLAGRSRNDEGNLWDLLRKVGKIMFFVPFIPHLPG